MSCNCLFIAITMLCRTFILVLVVSTATAAILPRGDDKVTLDVYFEALCPDSKAFITNQLGPQYESLSSFVTLRLIPFGKASFEETPNGGYIFTCQHGESECVGNKWHSCAAHLSNDISQALSFTTCLMAEPTAHSKCAEDASLDYTLLDSCQNSGQGVELLHANGVETLALKPRASFIPWLIFNKVWSSEYQNAGLDDLKAVVCDIAGHQPEVCK